MEETWHWVFQSVCVFTVYLSNFMNIFQGSSVALSVFFPLDTARTRLQGNEITHGIRVIFKKR